MQPKSVLPRFVATHHRRTPPPASAIPAPRVRSISATDQYGTAIELTFDRHPDHTSHQPSPLAQLKRKKYRAIIPLLGVRI
jgi:hypothetical protein